MNIGIKLADGRHEIIDTDALWLEEFAKWDCLLPTDVAVDIANHLINTLKSWTIDNYIDEKIISQSAREFKY